MSSTINSGQGVRPRAADLGYRQPVPYRAVFECLPSGILVIDAHGRVTGANSCAHRLLGDALDHERLRCCHLLGCRRAGTPLADHCVTELALGRSEALPEIRVEVPSSDGSGSSVWVTAKRIAEKEPAVILQLRPGVVGDRRRRTEPHWMMGRQLRVYTLGRTRLESGEGPLAGEWLSHRPGEVLKYLICERSRVVPIEELLETLWQSGRAAPTNVRQAVHTLRDRLEPKRAKHGQSSFVSVRRGGYELELANIWFDADDFEVSARMGLASMQAGDAEAAEPALTRASALYRGDFLADEPYAEWAFAERDRLRDLASKVLRALAELKLATNDLDLASDHLQRLAELEPYDLDAQRELLALMMRRGRHAEAHRRYEIVRRRYRRAFGEDPDLALAGLSGKG
ncbi:MAG: winged helix-turn-helix domain-containing protein [Solirubrobacterales bacterium]|nr:winged helix-turn-helix domain-containing protein [Solirubrobacterales bacterium]